MLVASLRLALFVTSNNVSAAWVRPQPAARAPSQAAAAACNDPSTVFRCPASLTAQIHSYESSTLVCDGPDNVTYTYARVSDYALTAEGTEDFNGVCPGRAIRAVLCDNDETECPNDVTTYICPARYDKGGYRGDTFACSETATTAVYCQFYSDSGLLFVAGSNPICSDDGIASQQSSICRQVSQRRRSRDPEWLRSHQAKIIARKNL